MKIALINPRVESYSGTLPPLGLLYIAAVLENNGFAVKLFDMHPSDDRDVSKIIAFDPAVVGMTILTDYWPRATHFSTIIKNNLPEALFVIGGVHVQALPEQSLLELNADLGVIGEGEYTMLEICRMVATKSDWKHVPGIIYRNKSGVFIRSMQRDFIENLDELPHPARHLLPFENYLVPPGMIRGHWSERSTTIMTSRGCPFSCVWCGSKCTFGKQVRNRSINNVIDELELLVNRYHIDTVWFVDDTFTLDKERVQQFCRMLKKSRLSIKWGCQAHVKTADEEMFKTMKDAGLVQLDFGVESGSEKVLASLKKNSNPTTIKRAFSAAKKARVRTLATFMFGSPAETQEDVEQTFKLAKEIKPDFTSSFFITPYPGTELMDLTIQNKWNMESDRFGKGLKKGPLLLVHFTEKELLSIREKFQAMFAFRNFAGLLLNPAFMVKGLWLFLRHPGGIIAGIRSFSKTKVLDDFFFAFLIYYTDSKNNHQQRCETLDDAASGVPKKITPSQSERQRRWPLFSPIGRYLRQSFAAVCVSLIPELRAIKRVISRMEITERTSLQHSCDQVFLQRLIMNPLALCTFFWSEHFEWKYAARCPELAGNLLDFGCGSGHSAIMLARQRLVIHGVDASPVGIAIAQYAAGRENASVRARITFSCADVTTDTPNEARFDAVWSSHVFEHILDPGPIIHGLRRWVVPGAYFLISVPLGRAYDDPGHVHHFFSGENLRHFLQTSIQVHRIMVDEQHRVIRALCRFDS